MVKTGVKEQDSEKRSQIVMNSQYSV